MLIKTPLIEILLLFDNKTIFSGTPAYSSSDKSELRSGLPEDLEVCVIVANPPKNQGSTMVIKNLEVSGQNLSCQGSWL